VIRSVLIAVAAGALLGAVVGGLSARLAMRLVALLTEGPPFTLYGAEVGVITLDGTVSLMTTTAIPGVFAGLLYAAVRGVLPSSRRALAFAGLSTVLLGAVFFRDDEFELFQPPLLAAALFLPFFPLFGFMLATLVERIDPQPAKAQTRNDRLVVVCPAVIGTAAMLVHLVTLARSG
jgi:hypothetical protein